MRRASIKKYIYNLVEKDVVILYIALFLAIQLINFKYGLFREEFRDYIAYASILEGKLPYFDYRWIYGPLGPFIYALIFKVFGKELIVLRFIDIFLACIGIVLAYRICKFIMPKKMAALSAFLAIACFYGLPSYTYNHFFGTLANLAAVIMVFRFIDSSKTCDLFLAGLLSNISFLIHPLTFGLQISSSVLIWLVLFAIFKKSHILQLLKNPLFFVFGASIFTVPIYLSLLSRISLTRIFDLFWSYQVRWVGFPPFRIDFSNVVSTLGLIYKLRCIRYSIMKGLVNPAIFYLLLFIVPIMSFVLAIYWIKRKTDREQALKISFLSILMLSTLSYYYYSDGRLTQYYLQPSIILLIFLIHRLYGYLRLNDLKVLKNIVKFSCLFLIMIFLFFYHGYRIANFFIRRWTIMNVSHIRGIYFNEDQIALYIKPSNYIKDNSSKDDKLFVTSYDPTYYVLSGIPSIFPENIYTGLTSYSMVVDSSKLPRYEGAPMRMEDLIIKRIEEEKPKFIIKIERYFVEKYDHYPSIGPRAEGHISNHYSISKMFPFEEGQVLLYKRRERS